MKGFLGQTPPPFYHLTFFGKVEAIINLAIEKKA
jgi:hypothetical protein